MKTFLLTLTFIFSLHSFAGTKELVVFAHQNGGYPADAMCFFSNNKMTVYGEGLLVRYTCFGKEDIYGEIWLVSPKGNSLIARSEMGNLLTDAYLDGERIYALEFNELETLAVYRSTVLASEKFIVPAEYKRAHIHSLSARGKDIVFRYTTGEREHGEGIFKDGVFTKIPPRNVTFFHIPEANKTMTIQKLTNGAEESVEVRFAPDFTPVTVLKDRDADPSSPFKFFQNFLVLQHKNWAVMSTTDEGKVVILGHGKDFVVKNLSTHFKDVDVWPGAITQNGEFVLRATNHEGVRGLWMLKETPVLLLTAGEEVVVDGVTIETTAQSLFYNAPVINGLNQLFIGVGLGDSADGPVMGQGILKLSL